MYDNTIAIDILTMLFYVLSMTWHVLITVCAVIKLPSDAHEYNKEHTTLAILVVHSFICGLFSHFVFYTSKKCYLTFSVS